jgi:ribosome-associated translation inhibitor RaiA
VQRKVRRVSEAGNENVEQESTLDALRLGTGFSADERDAIVDQFAPLGNRIRSLRSVDMELSVKERDGAGQRVTLELWAAGRTRMVATSERADMDAALQEVRDDMVRQVNDTVTRGERHHNQPAGR